MCTDLAAAKLSGLTTTAANTPSGGPSAAASRCCGSPSSSLEGFETSADLLTRQTATQHRVHSQHRDARETIIRAIASGEEASVKHAERMANCCRTPIAYTRSDGSIRVRPGYCRSRVCPLCSKQRQYTAGERAAACTSRMDAPRFITLTLREDGRPLRERLDRLATAWRRLRQQECWKRAVRGGIYGVQVTRGTGGDGWHVHMHVVADGTYFHHSELRAAWEKATGDSHIIDVRKVPSRKDVATYIARYVAHTDAVSTWSAAAIREYVEAFHGRRVLHTFGTMHGVKVDELEDDAGKGVVMAEVPLATIERQADSGDADALEVWHFLRACGGTTGLLLSAPGTRREGPADWVDDPHNHVRAYDAITRLHERWLNECVEAHGRPKPRPVAAAAAHSPQEGERE